MYPYSNNVMTTQHRVTWAHEQPNQKNNMMMEDEEENGTFLTRIKTPSEEKVINLENHNKMCINMKSYFENLEREDELQPEQTQQQINNNTINMTNVTKKETNTNKIKEFMAILHGQYNTTTTTKNNEEERKQREEKVNMQTQYEKMKKEKPMQFFPMVATRQAYNLKYHEKPTTEGQSFKPYLQQVFGERVGNHVLSFLPNKRQQYQQMQQQQAMQQQQQQQTTQMMRTQQQAMQQMQQQRARQQAVQQRQYRHIPNSSQL